LSSEFYIGERQPLTYHLRRTLAFAIPIIVARSAILIMATVDVVMTGWSGARELAYMGLGATPMITLMIVCIGALQATVVLVSQSIGAGEQANVGNIWRASLVHALILGVFLLVISFFAETFYLFIGQDPDISHHGAAVSFAFGVGIPGMLLYIATSLTLEACGHPRVGMFAMLGVNVANVILNGIFVLGWFGLAEPGGAVAAIVTSSILRWVAFSVVLAYMLWVLARGDDSYGIMISCSRWFRQAATVGAEMGGRLRRLGFPMGLGQGVESTSFAAVVFLAGYLGANALAAHQTTMTILTLVYMNAIGMAGATTIRVARAVGRQSVADTYLAGMSGVLLAMVLALPFAFLAWFAPEWIVSQFVDDVAVIAIGRETMWTIGWFFSIDAMMGVILGALRGLSDIWIPISVQFMAFWVIAVPVSWYLANDADLGAPGLWWGTGLGMVVSLAFLLPRFWIVAHRPITRA